MVCQGSRAMNPASADSAWPRTKTVDGAWEARRAPKNRVNRLTRKTPTMPNDPPQGKHQFASDNVSPVCPEAWAAMERANRDVAPPYGADAVTACARQLVCDLFESDCEVFFV